MRKVIFVLAIIGVLFTSCSLFSPTGTVEGQVIDATTGEGLEGVNVFDVDSIFHSTTTDEDGLYSFEVPEGERTLGFEKEGYTFSNFDVGVVFGEVTDISSNNTVGSEALTGDDVRFVLTWGETPYDLDSYLETPSGIIVYFGNKTPAGAGAELDVDDRISYGPETILIDEMMSGTYTYYVDNFSESPDITESDAEVKIYDSSGLRAAFSVPTSGTGTYWRVCTLSGSTITEVNTITTSSP